MIFYLLHYITTNVQCKRKKKNNKIQLDTEVLRRLTSDEKRQSYLLHVEVVFYYTIILTIFLLKIIFKININLIIHQK